MLEKNYDVIIIGAGPAGLTAATYSARSGLKTLIIENSILGGQVSITGEIKNFPGFMSITGPDLAMNMHEQAEAAGAKTVYEEIIEINLKDKWVQLSEKITTKAFIIATGASAKKLGLENEERFVGNGIAYCAICDGAIFKNQNVVLIGGGNSAVEDAIYLSEIVNSLTIINNQNDFTAEDILKQELNNIAKDNKNIKIFHNHEVTTLIGDTRLSAVKIKNLNDSKESEIKTDGAFVAIGRNPNTAFLNNQVSLKDNYIITSENMLTNIEGVYAAGDIRVKSLRQIITACADGAIAATEVSIYLASK